VVLRQEENLAASRKLKKKTKKHFAHHCGFVELKSKDILTYQISKPCSKGIAASLLHYGLTSSTNSAWLASSQ